MIHSGEVLDGYRAIRRIGTGGFGEVWLCRNEAFGDLRALKFIPATDRARLDREHTALRKYRDESGKLLNKALMPIEHANLRADGMFYVMPLADGVGAHDPADDLWRPLTLATLIKKRASAPGWFSSGEVKSLITPVLKALQMLDDARLVHRDVKPENILFRDGSPCLSDISLLDGDLSDRSRRGTYGYGAPAWYLEAGGHPDMYGSAATLFVLLTGKSPDKMAQSRHLWPPQGENSLSENERREWQNIHQLIARATDDDAARRFLSFSALDRALNQDTPADVPEPVRNEIRRLENELELARLALKKQRDEFERILESTMKALDDTARGKSKFLAGSEKKLAAFAERFEAGLMLAKCRAREMMALDLTKGALQTLKAVGDAHGPTIGAGLEELRSGIERILKADRALRVARVKEVFARALSLSTPDIGSLAALKSSSHWAGLLGTAPFAKDSDMARGITPEVLSEVKPLPMNAVSIFKIMESAQSFLRYEESGSSGSAERSPDH